jgi:predicted oxidoreductase
MRNHGVTLVTFIGLDVDGQAQVRRPDGSIIKGLYAAGEVIGATATTGQSFCSGMLITPGVVHARLFAQRLAQQLN